MVYREQLYLVAFDIQVLIVFLTDLQVRLSPDVGSHAPLIGWHQRIGQIVGVEVLRRHFVLLLLALVHELHGAHAHRVGVHVLAFVIHLLNLALQHQPLAFRVDLIEILSAQHLRLRSVSACVSHLRVIIGILLLVDLQQDLVVDRVDFGHATDDVVVGVAVRIDMRCLHLLSHLVSAQAS